MFSFSRREQQVVLAAVSLPVRTFDLSALWTTRPGTSASSRTSGCSISIGLRRVHGHRLRRVTTWLTGLPGRYGPDRGEALVRISPIAGHRDPSSTLEYGDSTLFLRQRMRVRALPPSTVGFFPRGGPKVLPEFLESHCRSGTCSTTSSTKHLRRAAKRKNDSWPNGLAPGRQTFLLSQKLPGNKNWPAPSSVSRSASRSRTSFTPTTARCRASSARWRYPSDQT